jgi:hypothetical protein
VDVFGLQNRNCNDAEGEYELYGIYENSEPDADLLKIGKAKSEDVMADGTNKRAHTSERKARQAGYPEAEQRPYEKLGQTTTGKAKESEAAAVRQERQSGQELPLNKERDKRYQI